MSDLSLALPIVYVDRLREAGQLGDWYHATSAVRRFWAYEEPGDTASSRTLRVLVLLEPTADGSDTLPTWLAQAGYWMEDLLSRTGCSIRLELVEDSPSASGDEATWTLIAAMGWRDPTADQMKE